MHQFTHWFVVAVLFSIVSTSWAEDWPQWRGPERDGIWPAVDIVEEIPAEGLPVRWRQPAELGYSGPAVVDGKVYLFEYEKTSGTISNNPGTRDKLTGLERLRCLDSATGQELWHYEYERKYSLSYPSGPRCTPTVDGDHVYILGAEGDLTCLKTSNGELVWSKSFRKDYGVKTAIWGHSAHPLVDGDTLYCVVGGEGSIAVAFNKLTGEEKWRALTSRQPGYCPPSIVELNGERQLLIFHPTAVNGLVPESGELVWSVPIESSYNMSIAQPTVMGNTLFTSGFQSSVCFELDSQNKPKVIWAGTPKTSISSANATPIYDGQAIYGVEADDSTLVAISPETGKRLWETKAPTIGSDVRGRHGTVFVTRQGTTDRYWLFNELGELILARLTPEAYEELGRQSILKATNGSMGRDVVWTHPAFAEGAAFVRNDQEIVCVSLQK